MSGMMARFFRWSNSKLIVTDNFIASKILKIVFYLSLLVYRRSRPSAVGVSCKEIIDNFDSDIKLHIDRSRSMGSALYWTGFHEFREFLFLHRYLKPDMIFVDVGANLGEYSLFAAKRLSKGKVLSFEPLPSIRKVFEENVRLNGFNNIDVYPFGLSAVPETMPIHEFEDVHEGLATFYPGERHGKTISVELKRLDDVVIQGGFRTIDFIKMDIEGGELKALEGSRLVIERFRPAFMVEVNAVTYQTAGYATEDVFDFFNTVSYRPYTIEKQGRIEMVGDIPRFANILFMPQ